MSSKFLARPGTTRWWAAASLAATLLVAACGGGQKEPFSPNRILAFGDESSVIEPDGRKYSINAFKITDATKNPPTESATELDCTRNPIWVQAVATVFNLAIEGCPVTGATGSGQIRARVGDKVADLPAQIAGVQGAALNEKDLALVMIGMNDILDLYGRYPGVGRDALLNEARVRGRLLGAQVNQLAQRGPAVVVLTVHDIGLSPFAQAQNLSTGDPTRSALISNLIEVFNNAMSVELINDGRLIGLAYADIETQNMVKFPANYSLTNVILPACTVALPNCTTATLVGAVGSTPAATAQTWLWADGLLMSPQGQARLGVLAQARATSNPF